MDQKVKPHGAWFLLVPVLILGGGIAAVALFVVGVSGFADGMKHIELPGTETITVSKAGDQILFYEQPDASQATVPPGLSVTVTPARGGEPLEMSAPGGNVTYNYGDVAARAYRRVSFPAAGEYVVTSSLPEGVVPHGQLAIGGDPAGLLKTMGGAFGLGFGGFVLGVIVLIVLLVMRGRSRKRINQQYWQQPPQGYAPGAQQVPQGPPPPR